MKHSIKGTAKIALNSVSQGNLSLQYDKDIVKWFKQHGDNEYYQFNIIYMNYENLAKQISKLVGIEFDYYIDYPYFDKHYMNCMDFHTDIDISDKEIKKALKDKIFTIKLKAEKF